MAKGFGRTSSVASIVNLVRVTTVQFITLSVRLCPAKLITRCDDRRTVTIFFKSRVRNEVTSKVVINKEPWRLDFDIPLSSSTTLPQSPLPFCHHSWIPSTNHPHFTLASFTSFLPHFFSLPFSLLPRHHFPSSLFPLVLYMPIICRYSCYRPALHYIHLYRLCYPSNTMLQI